MTQLQPERVCFIKPSALGDVVQSLPVLSALRHRWPEAHISWVIKQSLADLLADHPDLDEIVLYRDDAQGLRRGTRLWDVCRRLFAMQFDLAIDLQGLARSGLMTIATKAKRRIGFASAREGSAYAYTDRVEVDTIQMPALERYWHVVRALGGTDQPLSPKVGLLREHHLWAAGQLDQLPRPILAIHPGTKWQTKRLPVGHFAQLGQSAWKAHQASVVLFGGPGEEQACARIASQLSGPVVNLAGKTSLRKLAATSALADVFLSGDTGPMHLAAAVGTRVVSVFTCTSPLRAGPHGPRHRVIATQVECAASYLRNCPLLKCMTDVNPSRIWPTLDAALHDARSDRQADVA